MAKATAPATAVATVNIERERQKGLALVTPILPKLEGLEVVDEESYQVADELIGQIRQRRKGWEPIWGAIQERMIKPLRETLEGAYSINRDVDGALEKAEKQLKGKMADYKDKERLRIAAENRKRDEDAERLQAQIEETKRKLEDARGSVKGVLTRNLNRLDSQQQAVMETVPLPVLGTNSSDRVVKVLTVTNLPEFVKFLDPNEPMYMPILNAINSVLRSEGRTNERKAEMAQWPGVELVDRTQIVGH